MKNVFTGIKKLFMVNFIDKQHYFGNRSRRSIIRVTVNKKSGIIDIFIF